MIISAPVLVPVVMVHVVTSGLSAGPAAWLGFGYVTLFSMLLGFFAWYHGLALGGVARIGQIQLAQPLLTLAWSAALLGEQIGPWTIVAALAILMCVAASQQARILRAWNCPDAVGQGSSRRSTMSSLRPCGHGCGVATHADRLAALGRRSSRGCSQ